MKAIIEETKRTVMTVMIEIRISVSDDFTVVFAVVVVVGEVVENVWVVTLSVVKKYSTR